MATKKNTLLLTAVGIGAAVVLAIALRLGARTGSDDAISGGGSTEPSAGPRLSTPASRGDDTRMTAIADPSLTVIVTAPSGLPLVDAEIVATGPAGPREVCMGRAVFKDAEIGDWIVEVTHEGYLPSKHEAAVVDGNETQLLVTMYDAVIVSGTVRDDLGAPLPRAQVHFYTAEADGKRKRRTTRSVATDRHGHYEAVIPEARAYKVAVGPTNRPLLEPTEEFELAPGLHELDIVVPGVSSVRFLVDDPPEGLVAGRHQAHASLYARKDPAAATNRLDAKRQRRAPSKLPDPSSLPRRDVAADRPTGTQPDHVVKIGTGKRNKEKQAEAGEAPPPPRGGAKRLSKDEWAFRTSKELGSDGAANFRGLDGSREYRLVVEYRGVRFQATRSFLLQPGRSLTLRATLPQLPVGPDGKRVKGVTEPLNVFVEYHTPADGLSEVGLHWKE